MEHVAYPRAEVIAFFGNMMGEDIVVHVCERVIEFAQVSEYDAVVKAEIRACSGIGQFA